MIRFRLKHMFYIHIYCRSSFLEMFSTADGWVCVCAREPMSAIVSSIFPTVVTWHVTWAHCSAFACFTRFNVARLISTGFVFVFFLIPCISVSHFSSRLYLCADFVPVAFEHFTKFRLPHICTWVAFEMLFQFPRERQIFGVFSVANGCGRFAP